MKIEKNDPRVVRGVGPDVPSPVFYSFLNDLKTLSENLDFQKVRQSDQLKEIIKENSIPLAIVIRAVGGIVWTHDDTLEWVSYTPTISTDHLRAGLLLDINMVQIGLSLEKGFNAEDYPIQGVQMRFSISDGGSDVPPRLDAYNQDGKIVHQINLDVIRAARDVRVFAVQYGQAIDEIIAFSEAKIKDEDSRFSFRK